MTKQTAQLQANWRQMTDVTQAIYWYTYSEFVPAYCKTILEALGSPIADGAKLPIVEDDLLKLSIIGNPTSPFKNCKIVYKDKLVFHYDEWKRATIYCDINTYDYDWFFEVMILCLSVQERNDGA